MKAKNILFLSIGAVLLAASFVVAGVFYFKLKNVSDKTPTIVEQEVGQKEDNTKIVEPEKPEIPFEKLDVAWLSKAERLSEVETDELLNKLYPDYKNILDAYSQMRVKECDGDEDRNCSITADPVKIKLSLAGNIKTNNYQVYIMEVPDFCGGMGDPYITGYLVFYSGAGNSITRIITYGDKYFFPNPKYSDDWDSCKIGDLAHEPFVLFEGTVRASFLELEPPEQISLPEQNNSSYLKLKRSRYLGQIFDYQGNSEYGDFGLHEKREDDAKSINQKLFFTDPKAGNVYFNGEFYFFTNIAGSDFVYDFHPYFLNLLAPVEAQKEFFGSYYSADVDWMNGNDKNDKYVLGGDLIIGCGWRVDTKTNVVNKKDWFSEKKLVEIGRTNKDEKIYELSDKKTNTYYKQLFDYGYEGTAVLGADDAYDSEAQEKLKQIPDDEKYSKFLADTPIFFWQDDFGNWRVYLKSKYRSLAECGKPVIYLYPEKEMDIKVKVKPNGGFTKTEPAYNSGWFVRATPQSDLFNYADKTNYPYLFWEGRAYGFTTPDNGFVMSKDEVGVKMTQILGQLGLNGKETKDFLEFWQPKLEVKPYVFVTFVPQREFDKAAPLSVNPKPDTIIRVFMDYTLLDAPIEVAPMQIKTPERKGFTVVEWGGRLH